jgi:hypothetical protein
MHVPRLVAAGPQPRLDLCCQERGLITTPTTREFPRLPLPRPTLRGLDALDRLSLLSNCCAQSAAACYRGVRLDHPMAGGGQVIAVQNPLSDITTLEEARRALRQCPIGHPDRANVLDNLAKACQTRSERLGDFSLLAEAVELYREVLNLRPPEHPDRAAALNKLGSAVSTQYERMGDLYLLEEVVELQRQALDLCPTGHPDRAAALNNLANVLVTTFGLCGDLNSLAEAV